MRSTTRYLALGLAGLLLAACHHKEGDKNAPLAFAPADTPYVLANLDVLDDDTRRALLAQADTQLPNQLAQMKVYAQELEAKDADAARLLRALITELDGKSSDDFARNVGLDLKGHSALYGLGLAPVARLQLSDPKAFGAFVGRLETAYGKKFETLNVGGQDYRRQVLGKSGAEAVLAVIGSQAVAAVLPADASEALLRQALGLDRPDKSLRDDDRLDQLAKDKGYQRWLVGQVDLARLLPLIGSGKDPLFAALWKAHAESVSAQTGEPVANQLPVPASCESDAARIASHVPAASFGYTKLDPKHQDLRWDVALDSEATKAFSGLKVALPGLGAEPDAPFDLGVAFPVGQLRNYWGAQAEAVAAKPFACPALTQLNDGFAKLGSLLQKSAVPPFSDIQGLRLAVDSLDVSDGGQAKYAGHAVLGSSNPASLLAMAQLMLPSLASLKPGTDGKPVALPDDVSKLLGQPMSLAMTDKALALGLGDGEDDKLRDALKADTGEAGRVLRLHLKGDTYLAWIKLMQQRAELAAMTATPSQPGEDPFARARDIGAATARTKAQFEALKAQAARIEEIDGEIKVEDAGLVGTTRTELK